MKNIFSAIVCALLVLSSASFAADTPTKSTPAPSVAAQPAQVAAQEVVNINTADAQALTKLKGIGAKKAEAIVAFRKANGAFKTVDQLADVKGIGAKTVEANRKNIRI
jgi:competence protein ComEA